MASIEIGLLPVTEPVLFMH